ncbi:unnamed protein product [Symbiodinium natans]|uniref:Uncharacterized protein n=1 Tax=Symbiodinium natans TaxID=878477 RepID=A0A812U1D6_9DINO|nr:unnamed protein product [Symbiodinium natans]
MSSAVRVNVMFYCVFRLRNQLELDALVEELSAMLPKETLYAMYEEATREPYSFWFVNLRAPKEDMFWVRFDRKFLLNGDAPGIYDPSHWPPPERPRQTSDGSNASEFSVRPTLFLRRRSKKGMTSIYVDSRLRAEGTDSSFSFDIGESVHIQSGAKLAVYKVRVADAFLSSDRGTFLYWEDEVAGTLHYAELPVGAYTGPRLAAWISSNFAAATYTAETNELDVTYDGARMILNDAELRQRFPGCPTLANGETTVGPLGHDILCKIVVSKGVGHVMETETSEGHWVQLHGPITLRHLRFKLTDYQGNIVNTRGTSISSVDEPAPAQPVVATEPAVAEPPAQPVVAEPPEPAAVAEPPTEAAMLRAFHKQYPSYNLTPLLYKRQQQLIVVLTRQFVTATLGSQQENGPAAYRKASLQQNRIPSLLHSPHGQKAASPDDARAFNEWLANRRQRQEGEAYTDEVGRAVDAVNRRIPQLRWAPAERAGVRRVARDVAAGRNTSVLGYIAEGEPLPIDLPNRNASILTSSHFWLDDYPQSSEPEPAPLPHTTVDPAAAYDPTRMPTKATIGCPSREGTEPSTWTASLISGPWTLATLTG